MAHEKYDPEITDRMNVELCIARVLLMQIRSDETFMHEFGKGLARRLDTSVKKIDEVRWDLEDKTKYITSLDPDMVQVVDDMVRTMRHNLYQSYKTKRDKLRKEHK